MGKVLHGIPHQVLPYEQDQHSEGEDLIPEAWERLQEYIRACPHHGMEDWLVLQNFYEGLTAMSKGHVDTAAGGTFLSLTINEATALIEKMVANQS